MSKDNSEEVQGSLGDLQAYIQKKLREVRQIDYMDKLDEKQFKVLNSIKDPRIIGQYIACMILDNVFDQINISGVALDRKQDDPKDKYRNDGETLL